jgi:hypothetical protein
MLRARENASRAASVFPSSPSSVPSKSRARVLRVDREGGVGVLGRPLERAERLQEPAAAHAKLGIAGIERDRGFIIGRGQARAPGPIVAPAPDVEGLRPLLVGERGIGETRAAGWLDGSGVELECVDGAARSGNIARRRGLGREAHVRCGFRIAMPRDG